MIYGIISQATTQAAPPPQRWTDPAILAYALPLLLTFIAGIAGVVVWVNSKLNPVKERQDRQGKRIDNLMLDSIPVEPKVVVSHPPTPQSRVPGAPVITRPTHSTEVPPCDPT